MAAGRLTEDVGNDIFDLVKEVMHLSSARIQQAIWADGLTITAMEARCLRYIVRHPACTQRDIVAASGRDKGQIARLVKQLIERDAVERVPNERGERRQRLTPTSKGIELHQLAERHRAAAARQVAEALRSDEQELLRSLLLRLVDNLKAGW